MLSCRETQVLRLCEALYAVRHFQQHPARQRLNAGNEWKLLFLLHYLRHTCPNVRFSFWQLYSLSSTTVWALIVRAHHFHVAIIAAPCQLQLQSTLTWRSDSNGFIRNVFHHKYKASDRDAFRMDCTFERIWCRWNKLRQKVADWRLKLVSKPIDPMLSCHRFKCWFGCRHRWHDWINK